jgi:hypothetical protein
VGQDDVSIELVAMLDSGMFHDVIRDGVPIVTGELTSTSRTRLGVHGPPPYWRVLAGAATARTSDVTAKS